MRKKKSVSQRVRELIEQGHNNKYIVDKLKCKPQVVYNVRYQINKSKGLGALGTQGTGISAPPLVNPAPYKPITNEELFGHAPVKMEGGAIYPITMIEPPTLWQRVKGWFRGTNA
jgi:hypothetical protein